MATVAADIQAHIAELCDSSLGAFSEDMSSMFGIDFSWTRQQARSGPVGDLWKPAKKLYVTHQVEATGALSGTFHICFDQAGLFILCGVIVMLPETRIIQQVKTGSAEDAKNLQDAAREVGNLLVGSWDRVFRESCSGHGHFVKKGTSVGKPWEVPGGGGLAANEDVLLASYELSVGSYPKFTCAIALPAAMRDTFKEVSPEEADEETVVEEPVAVEPATPAPTPAAAPRPAPVAPPAAKPEPAAVPKPEPVAAKPEPATQPAAVQTEVKAEPPKPAVVKLEEPSPKPVASEAPKEPKAPEKIVEPPASPKVAVSVPKPAQPEPLPDATSEADEARWQTVVRESLSAMEALHAAHAGADSGIGSDGPTAVSVLRLQAQEIMTREVAWAEPDETVQQCVTKMQQQNCRYVLIGRKEVLEGIISISNIQAAISPYLRPMFARWRRPEDDATLSIKLKWIMSCPVRTAPLHVTVGAVIESMFHHGGGCLPLVNGEGVVQGIVTIFDILARFLEADPTSSWKGKPRQSPPLLL
jgi:CBS domain-containing protein